MKSWMLVSIVGVLCAAPAGFDPRLPVATLVREEIFAGLLSNDMESLARGEKALDQLLVERPEQRAHILAWQGSAALYRAVRAYNAKQPEEFTRYYKQVRALYGEAVRLGPEEFGVAAVMGGSYVTMADHLPPEQRAEGWATAYDAYRKLWKQQAPAVEKLPTHMRGELLAGLALTAERIGHKDEVSTFLDKMIALLPNTPYATRAQKWKENPEIASRTSVACQTCHEPGRLSARKAALR